MKNWHGRPEIEFGDHPETVSAALDSSIPFHYRESLGHAATSWVKTVQDAQGVLTDSFGLGVMYPGIELEELRSPARLYMSLDDLELALVNYGCEQLEDVESTDNSAAVAHVDDLLLSIDANR